MGNQSRLTTDPDPTAPNVLGTPGKGDHSYDIPGFRKPGRPVFGPGVFVSPALNKPGRNQTEMPSETENRKGSNR